MRRPAALLLLAALLLAGCSARGATSFYVDYAGGSDRADGRTPATAWKHAPGDANATGTPAATRLVPGDTVRFRGGVAYRGAITMPASGTAQAPITYTGAGWGDGMGVIDGSDPVSSGRPCRSAADCGGAPNWAGLTRLEFAPPVTKKLALFGPGGLYWLSQLPALDDPFFNEDRTRFAQVKRSDLAALHAGEAVAPALAAAARGGGGQMELGLWVVPNLVKQRPLLGVRGDGLLFDPADLRFYTDRDSAVSLTGSFAGLTGPGHFLVLSPGVILAWLRPGDTVATLSVGNGRLGISLGNQSFLRITGLRFRNLAGGAREGRSGLGIGAYTTKSRAVEIRGNHFGPAVLEHGQGIIQVTGTDGLSIVGNRFEDIVEGSGVRAGGATPSNLLVEGNVFRRLGRTAIGFFSVEKGEIRNNMLTDIRGIHGNAITAYMANRDIVIEGNCVWNSDRPLTLNGNKEPDLVNGITVRGNIFVSSPGGQAAVNNWGAGLNGLVLSGNIMVGPKNGAVLDDSGRGFVVTGNDGNRIAISGARGPDWRMEGNGEALTLEQAMRGQFSEEECRVPASRLRFMAVRQPR